MNEIKCPKCESPFKYKQYIRAPFEDAIEISYMCGARMKKEIFKAKPPEYRWIRECGFKINNEFY